MNKLHWIEANNFVCCILKKGNLYYICLDNFRSDKFLDDPEKKTINKTPRIKESSSYIRK